ncbi:hypothetical protein PVL29_001544 [Vitis rotundifolia]|uniref:DET1- and DDB1-associated protein 1 domain-containing protein n=1 Tax=Vitis rotundifolia TaxID=103349 RepID=A0AA39E3Q4_VITRO|nr:hypothetical protein PVL29_001544 [Vitis rotundifolia]|eukprot:XP_019073040.1 PREDICTED: uncharacterized protein LOC100241601 isoform X3 [Vitis vinifera]
MGSTLGDWPSFDPHNFSQLRPSDPSNPSKMIPATYHPTHDRTLPPPDQVETKESCLRTPDTRAWMQATQSFCLRLSFSPLGSQISSSACI